MTPTMTMITEREAEELVQKVGAHTQLQQRYLRELRDREGWRVLRYTSGTDKGSTYPSWRECALDRFGKHHLHTYSLFDAAEVRADVEDLPGEEVPDAHLAALVDLDTEGRRAAVAMYRELPDDQKTTANAEAVADLFLTPEDQLARFQTGELSAKRKAQMNEWEEWVKSCSSLVKGAAKSAKKLATQEDEGLKRAAEHFAAAQQEVAAYLERTIAKN